MLQSSYFRPSGTALLGAALEAMKRLAREAGGDDDVATPEFDGGREAVLVDFRRFAAAAAELAAKNPRIASRRFGDVGVRAMLDVTPDCHTYLVPASRSGRAPGLAAPAERHVDVRLLPGGIGLVAWRTFDSAAFEEIRAGLDTLLAQGARAWIFDVRANGGGEPPQSLASWFVKDGTLWRDLEPDGRTIDVLAQSGFYLPERYQLPIAVVIDGRTGSSPEFLTVALQQRGRARVFGTKSAGCLGGTLRINLPDGSRLAITESVSIGPTSDAPLNGVGIVPDVTVRDRDPVDVAAEYLRAR